MHEYNLKMNNKPFTIQVLNDSCKAAELKVNGKGGAFEYDELGTPLSKEEASAISIPNNPTPIEESARRSMPQSLALSNLVNQPDKVEIKEVAAPIPGSISGIKIKLNESLKKGQLPIITEVMKMENEICSDTAGVARAMLDKDWIIQYENLKQITNLK